MSGVLVIEGKPYLVTIFLLSEDLKSRLGLDKVVFDTTTDCTYFTYFNLVVVDTSKSSHFPCRKMTSTPSIACIGVIGKHASI